MDAQQTVGQEVSSVAVQKRGGSLGRKVLRVEFGALLLVALLLFTATDAQAATYFQANPFAAQITQLIVYLRFAWVLVIIGEVVAALTYAFAFFTQAWIPSLYQSFQGDWVKRAVILGLAIHPIMGALYGSLTTASAGYA